MGEQAGKVIDRIRQSLANAGQNGDSGMPEQLLFVPTDGVKKVRFLQELDSAVPVIMHDRWKKMKPQPCLRYYEKYKGKCPFDDDDDYKAIEHYAVTVWDYEADARRVLLLKPSDYSPLGDLVEITDELGTIMDRDIKIKRKPAGKGKSRYHARASDAKTTFEGKKDKPYSDGKVFAILEGMVKVTEAVEDDDSDGDEKDNDGDDD